MSNESRAAADDSGEIPRLSNNHDRTGLPDLTVLKLKHPSNQCYTEYYFDDDETLLALILATDPDDPGTRTLILISIASMAFNGGKRILPAGSYTKQSEVPDLNSLSFYPDILKGISQEELIPVIKGLAACVFFLAMVGHGGKTDSYGKLPPILALISQFGPESVGVDFALACLDIICAGWARPVGESHPKIAQIVAMIIRRSETRADIHSMFNSYLRSVLDRLSFATAGSIRLAMQVNEDVRRRFFCYSPLLGAEERILNNYIRDLENRGIPIEFAGWSHPSPLASSSVNHLAELIRQLNTNVDEDIQSQHTGSGAIREAIRGIIRTEKEATATALLMASARKNN